MFRLDPKDCRATTNVNIPLLGKPFLNPFENRSPNLLIQQGQVGAASARAVGVSERRWPSKVSRVLKKLAQSGRFTVR